MDLAALSMPPDARPLPGQIDYRANPSSGGRSLDTTHTGDYDHPEDDSQQSAAAWTDQTWKAYDEKVDATRFNGINTPEQQATLLDNPPPAGYSPDLMSSLAWERSGPDGGPPR